MSDKIYKIVMLGPQGSGKGTQAEFLSARLNLPNVSTGSFFRQEIAAKTPLGLEIEELIKNGNLVPDETTNKLMAEKLSSPNFANGYILDGYPRTLAQAEFLSSVSEPTHVLEVDISDETAKNRLGNRQTCPECGKIFHPEFKPAQVPGQCDVCKVPLITRADDTPEAIDRRLKKYRAEVSSILKFYEGKGTLIKINGEPVIEEVKKEIFEKLEL